MGSGRRVGEGGGAGVFQSDAGAGNIPVSPTDMPKRPAAGMRSAAADECAWNGGGAGMASASRWPLRAIANSRAGSMVSG